MTSTPETSTPENQVAVDVDVIVIGGGAAGLSAAVTLGRARRSVLVIDAGTPRNAPADAVHLLLTRDGITPAELVRSARLEVEQYGGRIIDAEAIRAQVIPAGAIRAGTIGAEMIGAEMIGAEALDAGTIDARLIAAGVNDAGVNDAESRDPAPVDERRTGSGFAVTLRDGSVVTARRLMVTTGLVDELPDIPGLRELWGRDVHHCPYCPGWELHGQAVGVIGSSPRAVEQALLFRQWVSDLVLFVHTSPAPSGEQLEQLAARGIRVVTGRVESLRLTDGQLSGVRLDDGTIVPRQALVVAPRMVARSALLSSLGLSASPHPMGLGEFIAADPTGLTGVPGVWVAGNVTDLAAGVVSAAANGMVAAAAFNADLIAEDTARAVVAHRGSHHESSGGQHRDDRHDDTQRQRTQLQDQHQDSRDLAEMVTQGFWDARYGSADAIWSGNPNQRLLEQAADLAPGTALDVGSGEGADAIWLAARGWDVTGVDISPVALDRAARRAKEAGPEIADRIDWQQVDLLTWHSARARGEGSGIAGDGYDLVYAQFMHLPRQALRSLHRALAAAVRPGGTLLIVGHHPSDRDPTARPHPAEMFYTADDVAAELDPEQWRIAVAAAPERLATLPDGRQSTIRDAVLKAVRRR